MLLTFICQHLILKKMHNWGRGGGVRSGLIRIGNAKFIADNFKEKKCLMLRIADVTYLVENEQMLQDEDGR